jgi:hypothetical protein
MSQGGFLNASMDSGFFEGFKRRRLSVSESRLHTALGEDPVPAAGAHQQKLDLAPADPIAYCRHLFTPAQFSKMGEGKEFESAGLRC